MSRLKGPIEQLIRGRAAQHPGEVWLKFKDQQFTWEQVLASINRAANGLLDRRALLGRGGQMASSWL